MSRFGWRSHPGVRLRHRTWAVVLPCIPDQGSRGRWRMSRTRHTLREFLRFAAKYASRNPSPGPQNVFRLQRGQSRLFLSYLFLQFVRQRYEVTNFGIVRLARTKAALTYQRRDDWTDVKPQILPKNATGASGLLTARAVWPGLQGINWFAGLVTSKAGCPLPRLAGPVRATSASWVAFQVPAAAAAAAWASPALGINDIKINGLANLIMASRPMIRLIGADG